jgi:hypothetical protein
MIETELTARFAPLVDATNDGDWADVTERAARITGRRYRLPLALAAALTVALAAAPALGLHTKVVRIFADSRPAPTGVRVKVLEQHVAPDSTVVVWVTREREGVCTTLVVDGNGGGGACGPVGDLSGRLDFEVGIHGLSDDGKTVEGPILIDGSTALQRADSLVLRFEDGDSASIPIVWVTAPIDTGFFVYGIPKQHWLPGHLPTTLTLLGVDGKELAQKPVHGVIVPG